MPDEPSILSNYGMSYALTGDLKNAEKYLRQALAQPGADSRVRQNLALVVGLSGRFDEAQKIASQDLSPEQAAANMAYLKQMLGQQNNWDKLKGKTARLETAGACAKAPRLFSSTPRTKRRPLTGRLLLVAPVCLKSKPVPAPSAAATWRSAAAACG